MAVQALHQLFTGLIMSKITYALLAFATTYRRRQEQDKCNIAKGSVSRRHTYCF